ncbi:MAG: YceI family protein [candidate division Zixibacteria bacterium]|nr:YceI family protein [candidate division Zixibacteria bacterium]MDH3938573.1 YceI family protein [candidate division Zixibacteria bacterium]MDH4034039.1 YceI family protein [candidate division Zixibacteria bacterium]
MFRKCTVVIIALLMTVGMTQAATWNFDKSHSSVGFSVRHMVISKTTGHFSDFEGVLDFSGEDFGAGKVEVTVQMASVDTDDEKRDGHLRTGDFFDVEKYPTMTFKSTKVSDTKDNAFQLTGILTIKDVSKEVIFDCEHHGTLTDPWGNTRAGFTAEAEINRQDFNVSFSKLLDGGGMVVGDMVTVKLEIEAIQFVEQADAGK